MQRRFTVVITTLLLTLSSTVSYARTWTERSSGRTVNADLVSFAGDVVKIRRQSDGRVFAVPVERLSDVDRTFVESASQTRPEATPRKGNVRFVAFNAQAQDEYSAEQLNASKRIVCVWKKGTAQAAMRTIEAVGLKVTYLGSAIPFGVCTGQLTEDGLKRLRSDPSIQSVEPDIELVVDDAQPEVRQITDEVLAAYEHAGRMVCVWKKGKKKESLEMLAQMEKEGKLRVIHKLETTPIAFCDWKPPLQQATLVQLQKSPMLDYVEPDLTLVKDNPTKGREIVFPNGTPKTVVSKGVVLTTPDDPEIAKLWGMDSIKAKKAWTCANQTDVVVAVIDSGVDYNHPDLKANVWVNTGEIPNNGVDDDSNGHKDDYYGLNFTQLPPTTDTLDRYGHGSHVAGTIGAVGNNKLGVAGVNWRVQVMGLKVFDDAGTAPVGSALASAIDYAVARKVRVINLSLRWGSERAFLKRVIDGAEDKGVLIVCSAGNLNRGDDPRTIDNDVVPQFPASFPNDNVIAVANITEREQLNASSHFGLRSVDLGAPGTDIYSTVPTSVKASGYDSYTGTSMASPHVAGAAALIWGHKRYSSGDFKAIRKLLLDNARSIPALSGKCVTGGTLDIGFLCKQSPPPIGKKPPIVICPPPRCYIPCPPRRHVFYRFRCGSR
ncbi:Major intracellular serine protease precursor [Bremerella volcania]|uniref:Major intracellular serine protease n=1 Tax=Bremerella volcania TaxID=2527984 RepID=A0A518CCG0_9BACT|nr:S8 family serine peptidase [Bremerella volcania]QDU76900.1 Major intracellular serine protease precursor [Bremerella volcania]